MAEIKQTLVRKGNVILLKRDFPTAELRDVDIIDAIKNLKDNLGKCDKDLVQAQNAIEHTTREKERLSKSLKDIQKFEDWAYKLQESKAKNLAEKLSVEGKKSVEKDFVYKVDEGLNDEQNEKQSISMKFRKLQDFIARHEESKESLHPAIISKLFYTECVIVNPWKK